MSVSGAGDDVGAIAAQWGTLRAPPRLVRGGGPGAPTIFEVTFADGRRSALRLHGCGATTPSRLRGELRWTEALADAAFACPWPQRLPDGALIATLADGRLASMVQWIAGTPFVAATPADFAALGALAADLHLTCDAVAPNDIDRPAWDAGAVAAAAEGWETGTTDARILARLAAAMATAIGLAATDAPAAHGMIHGDLLPARVLRNDGALFLTGFGRGGPGDRRLDAAAALLDALERPDGAECAQAFCAAYRADGGPSPCDPAALAPFYLFQAVMRASSAISRFGPADRRSQTAIRQALARADTVL